jgi:hypothetical protein
MCVFALAALVSADEPAARVGGAVAAGTRERWRECALTFRPSSGDAAAQPAPCRIDASGKWHAEVPAGVALDLRLQLRGFAPLYWFASVFSARGENDLGVQRLQRGGSVSGYVRSESGAPLEGADVAAIPVAPSGEDARVRSLHAKSDKRGFFQIPALAEGTWHLESAMAGRGTADGGLVDIREGDETALDRPLVQRSLQAIDVYVTPAVDRGGNPWHLVLTKRLSPASRASRTAAEGDGGANGFWRAERLEPGEYTLVVRAKDGGIRKRETVLLDQGTRVVSLQLDDVAVRGKVSAGSSATAMQITFVDDDGATVPAAADEEGEYSVSLPHEGTWHVEVGSDKPRMRLFRLMKAEVKRRDGEEFARVDIELPAGRVAGTVTDASGKPSDAIVVVHRGHEMVAQVFAEGGTFDIAGVREGTAQIDARTPTSQSELLTIDVTEKTEVALVLRSQETMRGAVVTRDGNPIAGVILRAASSGFDGIASAVTGSSGKFELALPSTRAAITVIVLAPGHPIRMIQVPAGYSFAEPVRVVAAPIGGRLRVRFPGAPPWPVIRSSGEPVSLSLLLYPPNAAGYPGGLSDEGFAAEVEPGQYTVCIQRPAAACGTRTVVPGGDVLIDLEE